MGKRVWFTVAVGLLTASCENKAEQKQVVAKGKDFELSVPEFDMVLQQAPAVSEKEIKPARQQILRALIAQKLFAQAALGEKLDRDVTVMQSIEDAKRRILANAYIDRLTRSDAEPTDREVMDYYDTHPTRFADRKVYTITQYALTADPPALANYKSALNGGGLVGLDARLAQDGLSVRPTNIIISSDMLPDAVSKQLDALHAGSPVSFVSENSTHLGVVTAVQEGAIPLEEARVPIREMIKQDRRTQLIKSQSDLLRNSQQIKIIDPALRS